jgi:hypothetical protein
LRTNKTLSLSTKSAPAARRGVAKLAAGSLTELIPQG